MITARLEEGISIKTCNQCKVKNEKYETASIDKMLKHLNEHRLDELIVLKSQKFKWERVLKE